MVLLYAVKTTGVCAVQPVLTESCVRKPCRGPAFRPSMQALWAECHIATDEQVQLIARICKLIEASETSPLLSRLATAAGLSQYYLQRLFRLGMTPKGYAIAQRASGCVMDYSRVSLSLKPFMTLALERVVI